MLWLWLSYRFDAEVFPQREKVRGSEGSCTGRTVQWAQPSQHAELERPGSN